MSGVHLPARRFTEDPDPLLVAAPGATGTDAAREAPGAYDEAALPLLSGVTAPSVTSWTRVRARPSPVSRG